MRTTYRSVLVLMAWLTACGPQLPMEDSAAPGTTGQARAAIEQCPLTADGQNLYPYPYCEPVGYCGDGVCDYNEDSYSCSWDCGPASYCGDGYCYPAMGEYEGSCASDCYCGDGICNSDEGVTLCPKDCGCPNLCGNGVCNNNEGTTTCPGDCGTLCGDGACNGAENSSSCPSDCRYCGDGICTSPETRYNCPDDCGYIGCIDVRMCPVEP